MSFQVSVGATGYAGWKILQRTRDAQISAMSREPAIVRSRAYVAEKLPSIASAEQLVGDYRLLQVTLGAYGLEVDQKNKFFVQKVLAEGVTGEGAFSARLSDKRYAAMAREFAFDTDTPNTTDAAFADKLFSQYLDREFERRVGETDQNLRLALNAQREVANLAARPSSDNTKWYEILGNTPLRKVFEGAFGFGSNYARLPIDRQLAEFKNKAQSMFGSSEVASFSKPENLDKLIKTYLVRSQLTGGVTQSPYSAALSILKG
ncbi:DUF1217 domain-containing protein [Paracoccus pacificus]|uniref:DUF1217 domain-containing protein n=1 Tax=Paracoccus pacificus TaxID=1463598 RepID=A0ABW4R6W9_9RHOB